MLVDSARSTFFGTQNGGASVFSPRPRAYARCRRTRLGVFAKAVTLQDSSLSSFQSWASSVGIKYPKLCVANFDGLRGMMAVEEIKEEEDMVLLPRSAAIALEPGQKCPEFCKEEFWGSSPWYAKLAVLLVNEKSKGSKSDFKGYIESLPKNVDTPLGWSDEEIDELRYPTIIESIKMQREDWGRLYDKLKDSGMPYSKADFLWGLTCVRSRSFSGPYIGSKLFDRLRTAGAVGALALSNIVFLSGSMEQTLNAVIAVGLFNILYEILLSQKLKVYLLAPGVDLINHSVSIETDLNYDYFQDEYAVRAPSTNPKGEQVFISYGKQGNDSLMQYYGFCIPDNPEDKYVMRDAVLLLKNLTKPASEEEFLRELEKLGDLNVLKDVQVTRDGFPAATLEFLRNFLKSDLGRGLGRTDGVESRLAELLVALCGEEGDSLGATLDEDLAALERKKGLSERRKWALTFRVEKRKILNDCLAKLVA